MKIVLNGNSLETEAQTLSALLEETGAAACVATAVNEDFVPASKREQHMLEDGDRVEIVAPMQGG